MPLGLLKSSLLGLISRSPCNVDLNVRDGGMLPDQTPGLQVRESDSCPTVAQRVMFRTSTERWKVGLKALQ
jgi:hypothetical protein